MDRLDELATFLAILETGSLAAASRKLRKSPAMVTRALAALEDRVGARLIERTTRSLAATEAGRRMAERARRALLTYEEVVRESPSAPLRGELRVTAPLVFGRRHLAPAVASFLEAHPQLRVELVLDDRALDLVSGGFDVAVRIGRLSDSGLRVRKIGDVRRVLVASPAYLAARGVPRSPADLAAHEILSSSGGLGRTTWRFRAEGRGLQVRLTPRLAASESEAMLVAARAGRGIGRVLSYQVVDDLASRALVRVLPELEPAPVPVQLVSPTARHLPPKTRAFLDHAARVLSVPGALGPA